MRSKIDIRKRACEDRVCNQLWPCAKEVFQITGVAPSASVDTHKILILLRDKCKEGL